MWKSVAEPGRPQVTIRRMRIACWITKATDKHTEYEIFIAFKWQKWLREGAWMFPYAHVACLVPFLVKLLTKVTYQPDFV
jgi:hypothetical protein